MPRKHQPDAIKRIRSIPLLPPRAPDSHKGTYGRVLVIGGSLGMSGAPALVGLAALRSGAGLVTIAVPQSIQSTVAALCPCATTIALPETATGQIAPRESLDILFSRGLYSLNSSTRPDVLAIGPGLGPDPSVDSHCSVAVGLRTRRLVAVGLRTGRLREEPRAIDDLETAPVPTPQASSRKPQASSPKPAVSYASSLWTLINAFRIGGRIPAVIDADALNLAQRAAPSSGLGWDSRPHPRTVITPHPGEMARLHGVSAAEVQADREGFAVRTAHMLANRTASAHRGPASSKPVVVLKGAGTLVTDGQRLYTNRTGNPGMATGGSGDVLTGIIAALIAQGLAPFDAAILGVHVHGQAGDLAAQEQGQISLIATDLLDHLGAAFQAHLDAPSF